MVLALGSTSAQVEPRNINSRFHGSGANLYYVREDFIVHTLEDAMRNNVDEVYSNLIANILENGSEVFTRNAHRIRVNTIAVSFNRTPLVSLRKTAWRNCLWEWEWFMSGSNSINMLHEKVKDWWFPWTDAIGRVRYNYSEQFRAFCGQHGEPVDQIAYLINGVKHHPYSTRNVITTWNTADMIRAMQYANGITNCHGTIIQAFVNNNVLDITTYQRSADVICGLPHNWFQYWAFLIWLAYQTGREVGTLNWIGGDVHIYSKHREIAQRIALLDHSDIQTPELQYFISGDPDWDFKADHFGLIGDYKPLITEKVEMVV